MRVIAPVVRARRLRTIRCLALPLLLLAAGASFGCNVSADPDGVTYGPSSDADAGDAISAADGAGAEEIDGGGERLVFNVEVEANTEAGLSVWVDFETIDPALGSVTVSTEGEPDMTVEEPGDEPATEHRVLVLGLLADRDYSFTASARRTDGTGGSGAAVSFHTDPLPAVFPAFEAHEEVAGTVPPNYVLLAIARRDMSTGLPCEGDDCFPDTAIIVDSQGRVVWHKHFESLGQMEGYSLLPDGTVVAVGGQGMITFDLSGSVIDDIHGEAFPRGFHHDVVALPNGNYLTLVMEKHYPIPNVFLQVDVVLEITRDGEIVDRWSLDELVPISPEEIGWEEGSEENYPKEPYHANALAYSENDDTITVSAFYLGRIIRFHRTTGELLWTLGRESTLGQLAPVQIQDEQLVHLSSHDLDILPNGDIYTYDNGNAPLPWETEVPPLSTRSLGYRLGTDGNGQVTATVVWTYDSGVISPFAGGVRATSRGEFLVTNGTRIVVTDDGLEVVPTIVLASSDEVSETLWQLTVVPPPEWAKTDPDDAVIPIIFRSFPLDDLYSWQNQTDAKLSK